MNYSTDPDVIKRLIIENNEAGFGDCTPRLPRRILPQVESIQKAHDASALTQLAQLANTQTVERPESFYFVENHNK